MEQMPAVSNRSNPPGRFLSFVSLLSGINPPLSSLSSLFSTSLILEDSWFLAPSHLTPGIYAMEMRCKSVPTFLACKHLSEPRALVTVLRSVGVTLDHCQLRVEVRWSLLLLGKQGTGLYEQWDSVVMCLMIIIMLLPLWMLTDIHELWNDVSCVELWFTSTQLCLGDRWVWSTNIIYWHCGNAVAPV